MNRWAEAKTKAQAEAHTKKKKELNLSKTPLQSHNTTLNINIPKSLLASHVTVILPSESFLPSGLMYAFVFIYLWQAAHINHH